MKPPRPRPPIKPTKPTRPPKRPSMRPAKGKRFVKLVKNPKTGRTRKVSYGQAGKARGGGDRIRPGTKKGDSYCARSFGIAQRMKDKGPNTPNALSRKKWRCKGKKSLK